LAVSPNAFREQFPQSQAAPRSRQRPKSRRGIEGRKLTGKGSNQRAKGSGRLDHERLRKPGHILVEMSGCEKLLHRSMLKF